MAILNMFSGGGGLRIPLEPVTDLWIVGGDKKAELTWTDPVDKYTTPGNDLAAQWSSSVVIRKVGSAPTSPSDGVRVYVSTTRNQHSSNPFVDTTVENETHYYYAVYAYTTLGAYSEAVVEDVVPSEGTPTYVTYVPWTVNDLRRETTAGFAGTKAIFLGSSFEKTRKTVQSLDLDLTMSSLPDISAKSYNSAFAAAGKKGIFYGGEIPSVISGGSEGYFAHGYDEALTEAYTYEKQTNDLWNRIKGASAGNKALFVGGSKNGDLEYDDTYYNGVCFTEEFTKFSVAHPSYNYGYYPYNHSGGSIGEYAVFGGGNGSYHINSGTIGHDYLHYVVAYSEDLTQTQLTDLSGDCSAYPGNHFASTEERGVFVLNTVVGEDGIYRRSVESYDTSLTKQIFDPINMGVYGTSYSYPNCDIISLGKYFWVFMCRTSDGIEFDAVQYDALMTQSPVTFSDTPKFIAKSYDYTSSVNLGRYALLSTANNQMGVDVYGAL